MQRCCCNMCCCLVKVGSRGSNADVAPVGKPLSIELSKDNQINTAHDLAYDTYDSSAVCGCQAFCLCIRE